ncbi:MAG: YraN family protein [Sedimenticola sp.]|nr:YraN family protein [Sedimenticola sp.]
MSRFFQPGKKGHDAESQAQRYLEQRGLRSLERNYRCKLGEIDIIMQQQDTLVFVEVRYRKQRAFGSAAESVTTTKQRKLIRAAQHYLQTHRLYDCPCRFDVLAIHGEKSEEIDWIPNAFQQELV